MATKRTVRIPVETDAAKARAELGKLDDQVEELARRAGTLDQPLRSGTLAAAEASRASEAALRRLGVTSDATADALRRKWQADFEAVRTSGVASTADIERAQAALQAKLGRLDTRLGLGQGAGPAAGEAREAAEAAGDLDDRLRAAGEGGGIFSRAMRTAREGAAAMVPTLGDVTSGMAGWLLGTTALAGGLGLLIDRARQFESTQAQTQQLLRQTQYASGQTADELEAIAVRLGEATLAGTQEVREAANMLLTFRSVGEDSFERVLGLAQDVASTGMSGLTETVKQLGKAMEDPVEGMSALRDAGVTFSKQQQAVIRAMVETNRHAEAQALILDVLEAQVGGAAVAAATGLSGALDTLQERFGRLQEAVAAGSVDGMTDAVNGLSAAVESALDNIDEIAAGAQILGSVVAARLLGPVLAAAVATTRGYANLGAAVATGNAVLLNGATAAKAKAAATQAAATADARATAESLAAAQAERARAAALVATVQAEITAESARLRAQINDVGRAARLRELIRLRADLAAATGLLTKQEAALAAAQTAHAAAETKLTAATTAYAAAATRASIAGRALAGAAALGSGALALIGGPLGAVVLAAGYLALRTSEYDRVQAATNDTVGQAVELTKQLAAASGEQRAELAQQRDALIAAAEAEVERLEGLASAAREIKDELYDDTLGPPTILLRLSEFLGIDALAADVGDALAEALGGEALGGTAEELDAALAAAREGLEKMRTAATETSAAVIEADRKTAAEAAKLREDLLAKTTAGYEREIALSGLSAEARARVEAADKAVLDLREKLREMGSELTAEEEARVRALVATAETAKGAGQAVEKVLGGIRKAWAQTQAAMQGGLDLQIGAITQDEEAQARQLQFLDAYAAKAELAAQVVVEAEVRKAAAVEAWSRRATAAAVDHYDRAIALARRAGQDTSELEREKLEAVEGVLRQREDALRETVDRLNAEEERHRDAAVAAAQDAADKIRNIDASIRELQLGLLSPEKQYEEREKDIRVKEAEARALIARGEYEKARDLAEEIAQDAERNASRVPDTEKARAKAVAIATEHMRIAQELIAQAGGAISEAETRAADLAAGEAQSAEKRLAAVQRQITTLQQAAGVLSGLVLTIDTVRAEQGLAAVSGRVVSITQQALQAQQALAGMATALPAGGAPAAGGAAGAGRPAAGGAAAAPVPQRAAAGMAEVDAFAARLQAGVSALATYEAAMQRVAAEVQATAEASTRHRATIDQSAGGASRSLETLTTSAATAAAAAERQARAASEAERALTGVTSGATAAAGALRAVGSAGPSTVASPKARWQQH